MKRKNDIVLIAVIIAVAGLIWLGIRVTRAEGAYAVVTVDGELYGSYPLGEDAEVRIGDGEHYNILVIKDGEARISEASCPDKLCINQGAKQYDTESIICLPNRVVVEIKGGEKSEHDTVVQ